jgi:hypothetical protein
LWLEHEALCGVYPNQNETVKRADSPRVGVVVRKAKQYLERLTSDFEKSIR